MSGFAFEYLSGGDLLPTVLSATLELDLRADSIAGADGAAVSTWADGSGNARDFTQTGSARPTLRRPNNLPYLDFDGVDDCLIGPDFADNLPSFAVFVAYYVPHAANSGTLGHLMTKLVAGGVGPGWAVGVNYLKAFDADPSFYVHLGNDAYTIDCWHTGVYVFDLTPASARLLINGSDLGEYDSSSPPLTGFSSTGEPVVIGKGDTVLPSVNFFRGYISAVLIYSPAPSEADQKSIETWLFNRWCQNRYPLALVDYNNTVALDNVKEIKINRAEFVNNGEGSIQLDFLPRLIESITRTAQNASIGSTNFTNGDVAGVYRVSLYLVCTTADAAAGSIVASVTYNDGTAARTLTSQSVALTTLGNKTTLWTNSDVDGALILLGSGSVAWSTTLTGSAGTAQYALRLVLERLA